MPSLQRPETVFQSRIKNHNQIMPAKVYMEPDADASILQNKTLAVLGFGSQGHAHALNLKDSGMHVIVGLYEGSKSIPLAREKGFEVFGTDEAVRRGDVIFVALPDTKQARVYEKVIAPNLDAGKTLSADWPIAMKPCSTSQFSVSSPDRWRTPVSSSSDTTSAGSARAAAGPNRQRSPITPRICARWSSS